MEVGNSRSEADVLRIAGGASFLRKWLPKPPAVSHPIKSAA